MKGGGRVEVQETGAHFSATVHGTSIWWATMGGHGGVELASTVVMNTLQIRGAVSQAVGIDYSRIRKYREAVVAVYLRKWQVLVLGNAFENLALDFRHTYPSPGLSRECCTAHTALRQDDDHDDHDDHDDRTRRTVAGIRKYRSPARPIRRGPQRMLS